MSDYKKFLELLDLEEPFTMKELKRAYGDQLEFWHPDRHLDKNERLQAKATEKTKKINEAYHYLKSREGHSQTGSYKRSDYEDAQQKASEEREKAERQRQQRREAEAKAEQERKKQDELNKKRKRKAAEAKARAEQQEADRQASDTQFRQTKSADNKTFAKGKGQIEERSRPILSALAFIVSCYLMLIPTMVLYRFAQDRAGVDQSGPVPTLLPLFLSFVIARFVYKPDTPITSSNSASTEKPGTLFRILIVILFFVSPTVNLVAQTERMEYALVTLLICLFSGWKLFQSTRSEAVNIAILCYWVTGPIKLLIYLWLGDYSDLVRQDYAFKVISNSIVWASFFTYYVKTIQFSENDSTSNQSRWRREDESRAEQEEAERRESYRKRPEEEYEREKQRKAAEAKAKSEQGIYNKVLFLIFLWIVLFWNLAGSGKTGTSPAKGKEFREANYENHAADYDERMAEYYDEVDAEYYDEHDVDKAINYYIKSDSAYQDDYDK